MNFIHKNDVLDLIEEKVQGDEIFDDAYDLFDLLEYDGSLHELIDSSIDIYYFDLRKWSVDNWSHIEDAMEEGLLEGVTDFHKIIQGGQYVAARQEMYQVVEEIFEEQKGKLFNKEEEVA